MSAERHFIYPVVNDILGSHDLIRDPRIIFDYDAGSGSVIGEKHFDDFVQTIRKTIGFPLGDQIFEAPYSWGNRQVKYQRYAERELQKTPALCQAIQKYFGELNCLEEKNPIVKAFGNKLFSLLVNKNLSKSEKTVLFEKLQTVAGRLPEGSTRS